MEDKLTDDPNYFYRETAFIEVFLAFDATVPESTDDAPEPYRLTSHKKNLRYRLCSTAFLLVG